jgi:hypothetical protein
MEIGKQPLYTFPIFPQDLMTRNGGQSFRRQTGQIKNRNAPQQKLHPFSKKHVLQHSQNFFTAYNHWVLCKWGLTGKHQLIANGGCSPGGTNKFQL